jgi:primosomal protein N''
MLLLVGGGIVLFIHTRTPEVVEEAPKGKSAVGQVDQNALKESRKRYYERAIADMERQKRRSPADQAKIIEMRQKLSEL